MNKAFFNWYARALLSSLRSDRVWEAKVDPHWQAQMDQVSEFDPELAKLEREKAAAVDEADRKIVAHLTRVLEG